MDFAVVLKIVPHDDVRLHVHSFIKCSFKNLMIIAYMSVLNVILLPLCYTAAIVPSPLL